MTRPIPRKYRYKEDPMANPVEQKVKAATFVSGAAVAILMAVLSAASDANLLASLPDWLVAPAGAVLSAVLTFLAGYRAQHTPR